MAFDREAILAQIEQDKNRFEQLINGDETVTVQLEGRTVKSLQGQINDAIGVQIAEADQILSDVQTLEGQASISAQNASASETKAQKWASEAEGVVVEGTLESAFSYANKAEASNVASGNARDASVVAKDESVAAKNTAVAAKDETLSARDTTVTAKDEAVASQTQFENKWQGLYATPPTLRPDGTALQEGDAYTDSNTGAINIFLSGAWDAVTDYVRRTSSTGSAVIPSGTTAQRDASPGTQKLIRFNEDTGLYEGYNGTEWIPVGSGATGGGGDQVFVENDDTVTNDYTLSRNAVSVGPITVSDTATLTIADNARWVVL